MDHRRVFVRLNSVYKKGGMKAIFKSITDTLHYTLRTPEPIKPNGKAAKAVYDETGDGFIKVDLPGYKIYVDPNDPGISTELLVGGIRESASYWTYREKLKDLPKNPTILEVGANIGYYAIAAAVDRPDATVLCVELDEDNIEMLKYNAKQNNVSSQLIIDNIALSNHTASKSVTVTNKSNLNTLQIGAREGKNKTIECITGQKYLSEAGYDQSDIDVLRMDVEGHESAVLEGFDDLEPKLAHLEIHPPLMSAPEWKKFLFTLKQWDIDLVAVGNNDVYWKINNLEQLPVNESPQVVLS